MKKLAIIGSGDLAQQIAYHAINDHHYELIGFFDDYEQINSLKAGFPILGKSVDILDRFKEGLFECIMIGIGYNHMKYRKEFYDRYKGIIPYATIIHPTAYIEKTANIGDGSFILPHCIIDKNCLIGENVLLNLGTVIAHDSKIDNHCFLSPSVSIAGKTHIKECCIIGINSTIIDNIVIEPFIQIGAGALVVNNLETSGLYIGIPAKLKRKF